MSFDINKETNLIKPNIKICPITKEITNKDILVKNEEYIKYLFYGNNREPAVKINKIQYIPNNLYIWKGQIHNIPNIKYDAEFIIETVNGNQKTFICILLKHSYTVNSPTVIDNLWNNTDDKSININLNTFFNDNKNAIYYKNGINTIIIPIKPFFIKTNLKSNQPYTKCFILPNYSNNYIITNLLFDELPKKTVQTIQDNINSFIEGFTIDPNVIATDLTENGLYLDCAPTSQSTNTLPSITIPLDANGNVNLSNSLLYSSIMNALILFVIIVFVFLSLPYFYKFAIVDVIAKIDVADKATRLTTVCCFIFIAILILAISLIIDGFGHGNIYQSYAGIVFALILFIGTIRIYFLRNNKDYNFQQIYNWNPIDLFIWSKEVYNYTLNNFNSIGFNYILFNIIVILCFIIPALVVPKLFIPSTDTITHVIGVILGFGISYNFLLATFAFLIYDTFSVKL